MTKIQAKQTALNPSGGSLIMEVLSVTDTNNTISNLQGMPSGRIFTLFINGVCYTNAVKNPPFTINGQTLLWSVTNSGFALEMADSLFAMYTSSTTITPTPNTNSVNITK